MDSFEDVARWRDAQRTRLRSVRAALDPEARSAIAQAVHGRLDRLVCAILGVLAGRGIVCYLPHRDEIDLTPWMLALHDAEAVVAVPEARSRHEPLVFRRWNPEFAADGCLSMAPALQPRGAEIHTPDIVVVPLLGWDVSGYRLGHGTGSFDRTLSRLPSATVTVGVGLDAARLQSIHPQPFDIRLRHVVTETETLDFVTDGG